MSRRSSRHGQDHARRLDLHREIHQRGWARPPYRLFSVCSAAFNATQYAGSSSLTTLRVSLSGTVPDGRRAARRIRFFLLTTAVACRVLVLIWLMRRPASRRLSARHPTSGHGNETLTARISMALLID